MRFEERDTTDQLGSFVGGHTCEIIDKETNKRVAKGWGRTSEMAKSMAWKNHERENGKKKHP